MAKKENILSLDLIKSLQYIEGWAIVKWHRMHGGIGLPSCNPDESSSSFRRGKRSSMPSLFDAFIIVENSLNELNNPWILIAFLLWCYPKSGTYEQQGNYDDFRPRELMNMAQVHGWNDEQITISIKKMEHQFLSFLNKKL